MPLEHTRISLKLYRPANPVVDTQAVVMCLQETKLLEEYLLSYPRRFYSYLRGTQLAGAALEYWGVCTLVKNNVAHQLIPINPSLQAVAVRFQLDRLYFICNMMMVSQHISIYKLTAFIALISASPPLILYKTSPGKSAETFMAAITFLSCFP